jgi:hypothetical protein
MRVSGRPRQRLFFGFKIPIDYQCIPLGGCFRTFPRGSPANDCRSSVHSYAVRIWKNYFAAERNLLRIYCAVAAAKFRSIKKSARGTFAGPINRDPGEDRLFARKQGRTGDNAGDYYD